eukprot:767202-Hanusia_phi.AAC.3
MRGDERRGDERRGERAGEGRGGKRGGNTHWQHHTCTNPPGTNFASSSSSDHDTNGFCSVLPVCVHTTLDPTTILFWHRGPKCPGRHTHEQERGSSLPPSLHLTEHTLQLFPVQSPLQRQRQLLSSSAPLEQQTIPCRRREEGGKRDERRERNGEEEQRSAEGGAKERSRGAEGAGGGVQNEQETRRGTGEEETRGEEEREQYATRRSQLPHPRLSIPHSSTPLLILNLPLSPHFSDQEFCRTQYSAPVSLSVPHPTIITACPPVFPCATASLLAEYTPPVYAMKSE